MRSNQMERDRAKPHKPVGRTPLGGCRRPMSTVSYVGSPSDLARILINHDSSPRSEMVTVPKSGLPLLGVEINPAFETACA